MSSALRHSIEFSLYYYVYSHAWWVIHYSSMVLCLKRKDCLCVRESKRELCIQSMLMNTVHHWSSQGYVHSVTMGLCNWVCVGQKEKKTPRMVWINNDWGKKKKIGWACCFVMLLCMFVCLSVPYCTFVRCYSVRDNAMPWIYSDSYW